MILKGGTSNVNRIIHTKIYAKLDILSAQPRKTMSDNTSNIPDYQSIMLPLLELAGDGTTYRLRCR